MKLYFLNLSNVSILELHANMLEMQTDKVNRSEVFWDRSKFHNSLGHGWGGTDAFRCLLLFAQQIPRLPHGEKRNAGTLQALML